MARKPAFLREKVPLPRSEQGRESRVRRAFELILKKAEKGVDGNSLRRIMRGSLRDTVDFSGLPRKTCRRMGLDI
jgi:hypothetical protein